ncbi:MAG: MBL fold metallo-hydrolase [Desulfobacteraceae bacterium]|nr:MAG: MBL fold metallo-hydrolase [Desulfobacteraceae bacterium]
MQVKFWGTRGSIAVPGAETTVYGGNTTCLEITPANGRRVIIDAGTGIRALGAKLAQESPATEILLLITHIHWDHVLGFPFFAPIYDSRSKIVIDGLPSCIKGLRYAFDNKMGDGFFPIKFSDLKAKITFLKKVGQDKLEIDGMRIESMLLQHPQGALGFRIWEQGKSLVFMTDNELKTDRKRAFKKQVDFCREADVLIHDAQYTPAENRERRGWGHSDYQAALELAVAAHVKKLVLFHHDPSRIDTQQAGLTEACRHLAKEQNAGLLIESAKENSEWVV